MKQGRSLLKIKREREFVRNDFEARRSKRHSFYGYIRRIGLNQTMVLYYISFGAFIEEQGAKSYQSLQDIYSHSLNFAIIMKKTRYTYSIMTLNISDVCLVKQKP